MHNVGHEHGVNVRSEDNKVVWVSSTFMWALGRYSSGQACSTSTCSTVVSPALFLCKTKWHCYLYAAHLITSHRPETQVYRAHLTVHLTFFQLSSYSWILDGVVTP